VARAAYSTDLTTLTQSEASTNFTEPTATTPEVWTNLNAITSAENDFFIQAAACTSATIKTGVGGLLYNNNAGFTIPTDGAVLIWAYWWGPGLLTTTANGGVRTMIGSGTAAFYWVSHSGSDDWLYGGWRNYAMADPGAITVNTVGSPSSTRQYAGWAYNALSAPARGNPYGVDAIRYGRCTLQIVSGDDTEYGRFDVAAEFNDKNTTAARTGFTLLDSGYHRLGLFQFQDGAYKWQGLFLMGTASTAVDFRDSNRLIFVNNTKHVTANFNTFEVRNASSRVDWTGITVVALGTVSKGRFVTTDNADINKDNCTFVDMNTFGYLSNSTILNTTYRRCGLITTGGATMTGCKFDQPSGSIGVTASSPANAALITNSTFISNGTGHGLEITGSAANMTLTNCAWTGYASSDGSTGNEAVFINIATGSMNLTISGGTTPSVRSAGCVVTVISGAVSATVKCITESGAAIEAARVHLEAIAGGPFPYNVTVTITNSGTTATVTHTGHGLATNDKVVIRGASHNANNGVFPITKSSADVYTYTMPSAPGSNPTGTIKATFVVLNGTTGVSGEVTMSRVFASAQPVTGYARKSSSAPFFKPANLSGSVSSTLGAYLTAVMISDD
jgi:hypothetical protein